MANIYDKSSLVLIPSGTKTGKVFSQKPVSGDGDFTFTRASAATRVNADGNIEKETQNLLLQSNQFDTTWSTSNINLTSGQGGIGGSSNAWLYTITDPTHHLSQNLSSATTNVFSIYAKANSADGIVLRLIGAPNNPYIFYSLLDGTYVGNGGGGGINPSSQPVVNMGNGWYRFQISATGLTQVYIYGGTSLGGFAPSGSIYIQDAQVEQGLVARDVITTTTAAVYGGITDNTPRLDYTDSSCPALLLEPQRTNLVTQSEYFGSYIAGFQTRTPNATTSPEGLMNAYKLTATSDFSSLGATYNLAASTTYTASFYIKNISAGTDATSSSFPIRFQAYDLSNSTTLLSETYLEDISTSEWKRMTFSFTTTTAASVLVQFVRDLNNAEEVYIYGAQLEAANYATSYIPTYGSSVTRVGETAIQDLSDEVSLTEGVVYIDTTNLGTDNNSNIISQHSVANSVYCMRVYSSSKISMGLFASGVNIAITAATSYPLGTRTKIALYYKSGDMRLYINGSLEGTNTASFTLGSGLASALRLIDTAAAYNAYPSKSIVSEFILFPSALTDQELIDLTTI